MDEPGHNTVDSGGRLVQMVCTACGRSRGMVRRYGDDLRVRRAQAVGRRNVGPTCATSGRGVIQATRSRCAGPRFASAVRLHVARIFGVRTEPRCRGGESHGRDVAYPRRHAPRQVTHHGRSRTRRSRSTAGHAPPRPRTTPGHEPRQVTHHGRSRTTAGHAPGRPRTTARHAPGQATRAGSSRTTAGHGPRDVTNSGSPRRARSARRIPRFDGRPDEPLA